jgi:hypothetical protein
MRIAKTFLLFIALGVILSHTVLTHHHHYKQSAFQEFDHHDDDHNAKDEDHHDHDGAFAFAQIDHVFNASKQILIHIQLAPSVALFEFSFSVSDEGKPENVYAQDDALPSKLRCAELTFRGPPKS